MNFFIPDRLIGDCVDKDYVVTEVFYGGVYIPFANGLLSCDLISSHFRKYILIMKSEQKIKVTYKDKNTSTYPSGSFVCGGGVDVKLLSAKLLIITPDFFFNSNDISFKNGVISNHYERIIASLFDMIVDFNSSINAILAIANLAVISIHLDDKQHENTILRDIRKNYLNHSYNLNALCKNTNVSRRSAQYTLSFYGTSFSYELKRLRVSKLKELINTLFSKNEKITHRISFYCFRAGFKSVAAAKRDFNKISGIELKYYIKHFGLRSQ